MPLPFSSLSALNRTGTNIPSQNKHKDVANASMPTDLLHLDQVIVTDKEKSGHEIDTISQRLSELQEELLTSLKEDISDWIVRTLGAVDINADNFIHVLDTGIILCKLSMVIEKKAQECFEQGLLKEPLPVCKLHCYENASSGSWYARDNTANFLRWCRAFGMTDEMLFDSEDLVAHHHERQVIYCLMELARIGARFGLEPPSLITMEKEIDSEMKPPSVSKEGEAKVELIINITSSALEPANRISIFSKKHEDSILDTEVHKVSVKCQCEEYVNKLSEGVFNVYGKRVFIRLLQGKHLMVRVGGGWDTFENYLLHHDPVQVFRFTPGGQIVHSSTSSECHSKRLGKKDYLVIRSKYKSSSFCSDGNQ